MSRRISDTHHAASGRKGLDDTQPWSEQIKTSIREAIKDYGKHWEASSGLNAYLLQLDQHQEQLLW